MLIIADPSTPQASVVLEAALGVFQPYFEQVSRMALHGFKYKGSMVDNGNLFITFDVPEERQEEFKTLINNKA